MRCKGFRGEKQPEPAGDLPERRRAGGDVARDGLLGKTALRTRDSFAASSKELMNEIGAAQKQAKYSNLLRSFLWIGAKVRKSCKA